MASDRVYLDHNASSPLRPVARDAMIAAFEQTGNASSVHGEGRGQRNIVENSREQVAALVNAKPAEVVFVSGATEANNIALGAGWQTMFASPTEHESVLAPVEASAGAMQALDVGRDGLVDTGALAATILRRTDNDDRCLVSLQMANNETGVMQDVAGAASFCRDHGVHIHTDAVQACGRVAIDFQSLGVDFMSLSSHKIGGPMGIGALIVRDGSDIPAMIRGGGQERRRRAGTENAAAIAGFGAATAEARRELADEGTRLGGLRDWMETELAAAYPAAEVVGSSVPRLPNTTCVALPGELAETTVIKLDLAGVAVSAGAACSSGKVGASHVLGAMSLAPELARSAIRISLGWNTTKASLETFLTRFRRLYAPPERAVA